MRERSQTLGQLCVAFATGLFTASCSLLLDFNQLETRVECRQCADNPCACTNNGCLPEPKANSACTDTPADAGADSGTEPAPTPRCGSLTTGPDGVGSVTNQLVQGHRLEELKADQIGKTQVLVGKDFLYHVAYVEQNGKPDVVLRSFALDALNDAPIADTPLLAVHTHRVSAFVENGYVVRSPGSIVVDADNRVFLYVAQGSVDSPTAQLGRLVFSAALSEAGKLQELTDPPNYRVGTNPRRVGPAAGYLNDGQPFVVWQGCRYNGDADRDDLCAEVANTQDGSAVFTHTGEDLLRRQELTERGAPEPFPIAALQVLSNGIEPAAVWGTTIDNNITLTAGLPDAAVARQLLQCDGEEGALTSIQAAQTYQGISSVVWSKRSLDSKTTVTEATSVVCGSGKCVDDVTPSDRTMCDNTLYQRRVFESIRAAAHGVWMLDPKPTINSEAVTVSAKIEVLDEGQTRLSVARHQGVPNPNVSPILALQTDELAVAVAGTPDWPELSVQSSTHRKADAPYAVVGVGWVEDSNDGPLAKLQTFDLCVPP